MGGCPHPFFEVEGCCGQQKIDGIPCCTFEIVAEHPEIMFHMADYCFDYAPASEFGLRLAPGMRRCVFAWLIGNFDSRPANISFTAKTPITIGRSGLFPVIVATDSKAEPGSCHRTHCGHFARPR